MLSYTVPESLLHACRPPNSTKNMAHSEWQLNDMGHHTSKHPSNRMEKIGGKNWTPVKGKYRVAPASQKRLQSDSTKHLAT